jgi:hypothetical protein
MNSPSMLISKFYGNLKQYLLPQSGVPPQVDHGVRLPVGFGMSP